MARDFLILKVNRCNFSRFYTIIRLRISKLIGQEITLYPVIKTLIKVWSMLRVMIIKIISWLIYFGNKARSTLNVPLHSLMWTLWFFVSETHCYQPPHLHWPVLKQSRLKYTNILLDSIYYWIVYIYICTQMHLWGHTCMFVWVLYLMLCAFVSISCSFSIH